MTQPNPILQSNLAGVTVGDWSDPVPAAPGDGPVVIYSHKNTEPAMQAIADASGTYGYGIVFGNAGSFGGTAQGSPPGLFAPLAVHYQFGKGQSTVTKSTQAIFISAEYFAPVVDDAAEAGNSGVYLKNTGTPWTQTLNTTAWEMDAQVEGNVTAAGYVLGGGSRMTVINSGFAEDMYGFKADGWTQNSKGAAGYGPLVRWKGFFDELYAPAGASFDVNSSFYGVNGIVSEQQLLIQRTGYGAQVQFRLQGSGGGSPALGLLVLPDVTDNTVTIADGAFTNGSTSMRTSTLPSPAWNGRNVTNANVPAGTQVLTSYVGAGPPYTVTLTNNATATVSGQTVTIGEADLIGLRLVGGKGQLAAFLETWAFGATNANARISRTGQVLSTSGFAVYDSTLATAQAGIDANGLHVYASARETTGAATASLGTNSPATVPGAPYKWFKATTSDGTSVFFPVWK